MSVILDFTDDVEILKQVSICKSDWNYFAKNLLSTTIDRRSQCLKIAKDYVLGIV